jgi:hypothetical protein
MIYRIEMVEALMAVVAESLEEEGGTANKEKRVKA